MKLRLTTIGTIVSLFIGAASARADVILSDDFSYPDGLLTNVAFGKWFRHSGTGNDSTVTNGVLRVSGSQADDVNAGLTNAPYTSNGLTAALYAKFTMVLSNLPSGSGTYFAHFKDAGTGTTFRGRIFSLTNGTTSLGNYRLGIANNSSMSATWATDLVPMTSYTVVTRYVLASGVATLWIEPAKEGDSGIVGSDTVNVGTAMSTYAFRQAGGEGIMYVDDLVVGTRFADVVPSSAGQNPPFITLEPKDASISIGATATFSVTAGGDAPTYQWYKNDTVIGPATSPTYSFVTTSTDDSGAYECVIANSAGSITSRVASLTVAAAATAPSITNHPQSLTVTYGSSALFSVGATGTDPLYYQWYFNDTNKVGANSAFYTVSNASSNNAGGYKVVITNVAGAATSSVATLTVVPPPVTNIAYLRSMMDANYAPTNTTTLFTAEGIVTTWASMTTSTTNSSFYFQDSTAGIGVFWTGPNAVALLPHAGDRVRVTAPLSTFRGLLQFAPNMANPLHSVTVVSSGNPLPAAKPVPFDSISQNDPTIMEALEGSYVVASNVVLDASSSTFVSTSGGENITDQFGQTFLLYIGAYTDIPFQIKPTGPVTIFGVMGQFDTSNPLTSGYELIPSRYDDIVSASKAAAIAYTNTLSNLVRPNGQPVNNFQQNVLRPGESLTMSIRVTDPNDGPVIVTPLSTGLPATASWSIPTPSGTAVYGTFTFSPTAANAGSNYTVALRTDTATTTATNIWTIYVPTPDEQKVFITEFLANPSTDSSAPSFNPLHRATVPPSGVDTTDEYVEIVNLSANPVDLYNWTVSDAVKVRHKFYSGITGGESIGASGAVVVYGGPLNGYTPVLPVPAFPASESSAGLALNNTGTETITLRNTDGNIVDRIVYNESMLSSLGSLSRFPTVNDWFAPQAYMSTNVTTAGLQYDGAPWDQAAVVPAAVTGVSVQAGNPLVLSFSAVPNKFYTLWNGAEVKTAFLPVNGASFATTAGAFYVTNPPPQQSFFYITTP